MVSIQKVETKKCKICGQSFQVQSFCGNPYKWCPACRENQYENFGKICKDYHDYKERWRRK